MSLTCEAYLEDPQQCREHLAECESCRKLEDWLKVAPDARPRAASIASRLPVAPWEGADYQSWGVVALGAVAILASAATLFLMVGISPLEGFAASMRALVPRFDLISAGSSIAELLKQAPLKFHLFVATAFVLVNVLFVYLLRRPTKGYDLTIR